MTAEALRFLVSLLALIGAVSPPAGAALSRTSFDPSSGDVVTYSYVLPHAAVATVEVLDPDGGVVRTLTRESKQKAGLHRASWNGRDEAGVVVPDEAYSFRLRIKGEYPPPVPGPAKGDLKAATFDAASGTMTYTLPVPARVLIRFGIKNGPMLKTLVDWKPRVAGAITEYWTGWDADHCFDLRGDTGFNVLLTYVGLPPASAIAFGNPHESYRDYKRAQLTARKPPASASANEVAVTADSALAPPAWTRAPEVTMSFPMNPDGRVHSTARVLPVRVDVDPSDLPRLAEQPFEVIFYVDKLFFAEAERGHIPLNWGWELGQIPAGDHVLTVNVVGFRGDVGVASRKITLLPQGR
jgi:hypothetical protein